MKWLLLMIVAEISGEMTVYVLSDHETMSQCHFAATFIDWSEMMAANKELMCFPTDLDIEVME